ncbi:GP88 family protein [Embleya sp. MST-111070]|uniref:GP88 family protein n=1 Tax=Embleya sp. MST-111070 TaxID=3398231 RepID=UPI003F736B71
MSASRLPRVPSRWLLTQGNAELRREGTFKWSLPAWAGRLDDGRVYNTCPTAGICAKLCYARTGTYRFSGVLAAHERNLKMILDTPELWEARMSDELQHDRYQGKWVRIHDSGDFFSDSYLRAWLRLARGAPTVTFYCYTKEISRFRRLVEENPERLKDPRKPPSNFLWCYSFGGREDHLIDPQIERHADVFPDVAALEAAGYADQTTSDRLAVLGPEHVGIPANNIPHLLKRQGRATFGTLQQAADARLAAKRERAAVRASGHTQ